MAQLRRRLANQGLSPDSAAGQAAMRNLQGSQGRQALGAMAQAISEGNRAGSDVFRNNMAARQQAISEALRARQMPWDEMNMASGLLGMPSFSQAGRGTAPDLMGAAALGRQQDMAPFMLLASLFGKGMDIGSMFL
jgi:hypothetical protein